MRIKKIILLLIVLIIYSCSDNNSKNNKNIKVDENNLYSIDASSDTIKFSEILKKKYKFIKLQTNKNSIFSYVSDIKFTRNKIYILDQMRSSFLTFNKKGKFIKKLKQKGKGPGEYSKIQWFTLNRSNNEVYIYDDINRTILTFSFKLNFKRASKLPFYFYKFEFMSPNNFLFHITGGLVQNIQKYKYHLIVTDNNFKVRNKFLPINIKNSERGAMMLNPFKKNNFMYNSNLNNIVYTVSSEKIKSKYKINFKNHKLPPNDFYEKRSFKSSSEISNDILNSNYIYSYIFNLIHSKAIIYYYADKHRHLAIINNKTGEQVFSDGKIIDDFGFHLGNSQPISFHKDKIVYVIYPIITKKRHKKYPNRQLNSKIKNMKIEDNPALVLFELKEKFIK